MSTLPLSAGLFRFDLLASQSRNRREMLVVAEQKLAETEAEATAARRAADEAAATAAKAKAELDALLSGLAAGAPEDEARTNAAKEAAQTAADTAAKREEDAKAKAVALEGDKGLLGTLRTSIAKVDEDECKLTVRPVYLLRVPNFRINSQFDQCYYDVPLAPTDRKLWHAIQAAVQRAGDEYGVTTAHPDFQALDKAFRETGGGKVPQAVVGLFEDLFARTSDSPEVRKILKLRKAHTAGLTMLRLRFYVAGLSGLPGAEDFSVERSEGDAFQMATEDSIALIPPSDIDAILQKLDDLGTARGREGNS
ncbi:hypothetical protein ABNQ39_11460 [Azospirillum sp. A26]|uniref:hypothetical protein n=1 Tax=Azospirillum sp. A26 TaxID=3160607 RepID=UPI00366F36A8